MNRLLFGFCVLLLGIVPWSAQSETLPTASSPEEVGLSKERLDRIGTWVEGHIEDNRLNGVVALIARHGKIGYFESFGMRDEEAGAPMKKDAIFRIYSMSKPITSVGVMMLCEEGRFMLTDPVSKYIPALGELDVGVSSIDPDTGEATFTLVPAEREITVQDLLRHTSGLTYGFFGGSKVDQMYGKAGILSREEPIGDNIDRLGNLPLLNQPGATWHYSVSTDVLGRLIEVLSGMPFDQYLQERIFEPLGMVDTGFHVPRKKRDRLAAIYSPREDGTLGPPSEGTTRNYLEIPKLFSGGGGLVSTATDYLRFAQMLLNGGQLDGVRLLSRKTVELMTQDHLGDIPMSWMTGGLGFGLGFGVLLDTAAAGTIGSEGAYHWGGAAHTLFWVDPKEDLIGIFLTQIKPYGSLTHRQQFRAYAYQAIDD